MGFFAKLYVFFAVVSANYTTVAALALLLSSASAVYYLKVDDLLFSLLFSFAPCRQRESNFQQH